MPVAEATIAIDNKDMPVKSQVELDRRSPDHLREQEQEQ